MGDRTPYEKTPISKPQIKQIELKNRLVNCFILGFEKVIGFADLGVRYYFNCRVQNEIGIANRFFRVGKKWLGLLILGFSNLTRLFPHSDKRLVPTNRHAGGFQTLNSYSEAQRGLRKKRYRPGYRGNVLLLGSRFSLSVNLNHQKWLTINRSTNWNFWSQNSTIFHLMYAITWETKSRGFFPRLPNLLKLMRGKC